MLSAKAVPFAGRWLEPDADTRYKKVVVWMVVLEIHLLDRDSSRDRPVLQQEQQTRGQITYLRWYYSPPTTGLDTGYTYTTTEWQFHPSEYPLWEKRREQWDYSPPCDVPKRTQTTTDDVQSSPGPRPQLVVDYQVLKFQSWLDVDHNQHWVVSYWLANRERGSRWIARIAGLGSSTRRRWASFVRPYVRLSFGKFLILCRSCWISSGGVDRWRLRWSVAWFPIRPLKEDFILVVYITYLPLVVLQLQEECHWI